MRLNPFDPSNIRVTEGGGGGFPGGGGGRVGCGTLVIALIGAVVFGIDPGQMIGAIEGGQQQTGPAQTGSETTDARTICSRNAYATEACNALDSLNRTWEPLFKAANLPFEQPVLHFYQGYALRLRRCAKRHGPVLLPRRPRHLHRHQLL